LTPVTRTHEWIQREYGQEKFPAAELLIEEAVDAGGETLADAIAYVVGRDYLGEQQAVIGGRRVNIRTSLAFAAFQGLLVAAVRDEACKSDTEHGYNRNPVELLRAQEAAGRLAVDVVRPEVVGLNRQNSTTVIRWRPGVPAPPREHVPPPDLTNTMRPRGSGTR
jgi:hypothetical protein